MELYILSLFTSNSLRSQETKGASVMGYFPRIIPLIASPKISPEGGPREGKILQISRERKSSCHMSGPRLHLHLTTFNALEVNYPGESILSFLGKEQSLQKWQEDKQFTQKGKKGACCIKMG